MRSFNGSLIGSEKPPTGINTSNIEPVYLGDVRQLLSFNHIAISEYVMIHNMANSYSINTRS